MRLFVAVDLAAAAVEEAARVADEIRRRRAGLTVRWVPPASMHLTVRFIGHVAAPQEALIAAVTQPVAQPAFDVTLGSCGAFPASGAVRVVWIGLSRGAPELQRVSAAFDERLQSFGFEAEAREFSPHLTLARAPRDGRLPRDLRDTLAHVAVRPIVTRVDRAILYRSHLSPRGPRYEALSTIPLH